MTRVILTHEEKWIKGCCKWCKREFEFVRWKKSSIYCSRGCYIASRTGVKSKPMPQKTKDAISKANLGRPSKLKGKKFSYKHRRNLSIAMKGKRQGESNPNWRGGKRYDGQGYVLVYSPSHPNRIQENYVYEHRLVMEKHLGRFLNTAEHVHHINEVKDDNRIENLMLFKNNSEHMKYHHRPQ